MKGLDEIWLSEQPRQPWRQCPYCGVIQDGATGINDHPGAVPEPDSVMICGECGEFGMLDDTIEGGWRQPTFDERQRVMNQASVVLAISVVRAMIERRRD